MDRLHAVGIALLVAAGCTKDGGEEKGKPVEEDTGRVNAVETVEKKAVSTDEFCDVLPKTAAEAKPLSLPPLAGGQPAPGASASWRWVNVWATWCHPCIEEMPLLMAWQKQLAGEGLKVELLFVSADDSDAEIDAWRKQHPQTPASLRIDKPETALPTWLGAIGIGENAPIPVHLLVDPAGKVRCVRAGQVKESDLPAVRSLLKSG
jgi:thiol-disulfide isomerase/thioredoxin